MNKLKFILSIAEIDFNIKVNIDREIGMAKINHVVSNELNNTNINSKYRLIGSLDNLDQDEITFVVEKNRSKGNIDLIKANLKVMQGSSFELSGTVKNKCSPFGEIVISIALIVFLIYTIPNINPDRIFLFPILPGAIIWLLWDIYTRPLRAIKYLKEKIIRIEH